MGLLLEYVLINTSWYKVVDDLIQPWSAKCEFYDLICIDTATNLVELICIDTKSSDTIARKFEQTWISQYPRTDQIVHDNGGKFMGNAFSCLLRNLWIKHNQEKLTRHLASFDDGIATTMYSSRCTISMILKASLGTLVFPVTCYEITATKKGRYTILYVFFLFVYRSDTKEIV